MENPKQPKRIKIENFGPHEKLTDRIRGLLDGYKDGISIFKELVQNADDAKACTVKFCYDKRENNEWKNVGCLFDPEMVKLQGPSLFVYNNALFTDEDFENLSKLGGATKQNKAEKIGKFGLGFCSLYNITDVPCIISQSKFVAFDPNIKYLKTHISDRSNPGIRINLNDEDTLDFLDQFKPYENVFGCNIFGEKFFFNGTLIRLPLRNEPSDISSLIYNKTCEISSLFEILYKNAGGLLLFTQNVKRVEFYILEDKENVSNMKLLFEFEKTPLINLKNESLSENISDEFREQSNILRLALNRENDDKIETSFIVKNKIVIDRANTESFFSNSKILVNLDSIETYWLVVCSFDPAYLVLNDANFSKFLPCVGIAVQLDILEENYKVKSIEGAAFCFLPLSIVTNLTYHINGPFSLSEDRLKFYEHTNDDKKNNNKHEWNNYLIEPLVKNLFSTIKHANRVAQVFTVNQIVETFWPINNQTNMNYFKMFEAKFYQEICHKVSENFPYLNDKNQIQFCSYEKCMFVDFFFNNDEDQTNALIILNELSKKKGLNLIYLPKNYLAKIKEILDSSLFIDDYDLLQKVITNKFAIKFEQYEKLIAYYLKQLPLVVNNHLTKYAILFYNEESIPTCNKGFLQPNKLIDPYCHELYKEIFEDCDGFFPSRYLCGCDGVIKSLKQIGLLDKCLTTPILVNRIEKVSLVDISKARELSANLIKYFDEFFENKSIHIENYLKEKINGTAWLFAKKKPVDWFLPWFTDNEKNENQIFKPSHLFADEAQLLVGSIYPLFESKSCKKFMTGSNLELNHVINQMKYLISCFDSKCENQTKTNDNDLAKSSLKLVFEAFNRFFVLYSGSNSSKVDLKEKLKRLIEINEKLPLQWILNLDKGVRFVSVDSCAFNVQNPTAPDLILLNKNTFYEIMGVSSNFSLEYLQTRIINLKDNYSDQPLNKTDQNYIVKIIQEMINVAISILHIDLVQTLRLDILYLPDEKWILREHKDLCSSKDTQFLVNSGFNLYVLEQTIPAEVFGIKTAKQKIFGNIRVPFGQKENLVLRIQNILSRYSSDMSVFKELVQNADDAGATEIKFILDTRDFKSSKAYERLQGPALCCWHNSIFKESDFEGIISLGLGSKLNDMNKCGKFGVGFNSVYHLTDCPQFISDSNDYVIFDPLCECFPDMECSDPGCRIPNGKIKLEMFSEIFRLYKIGLELRDATFFRLPLRSKKSKLSTTVFNKITIEKLIDLYRNASNDILLFLRNVKKISFYRIDEKSNNLNCLNEDIIEINKTQLSEKEAFSREIKLFNEKKKSDVPLKQISYTATVKNLLTEKKSEYLVVERIGWGSNVKISSEVIKNKFFFKMFPFASIALKMEDIFTNESKTSYKIYNFLPLEQESPLEAHLNSHWCLYEENRTKLYEFGQKNNNLNSTKAEFDKYAPEWNLSVINSLICPLYVELFNSVKQKINQFYNPDNIEASTFVLKNYYKLFPDNLQQNTSNNDYFKQMFTEFYLKMKDVACIPIINNSNGIIEWFQPSEIFFIGDFTSFFISLLQKFEMSKIKKIISIFNCLGIKISDNADILNLFKKYGEIDLQQFNSKIIIKCLKENAEKFNNCHIKNTLFENMEIYTIILSFCLYKGDVTDLEGCPLLLTGGSKLVKFSSINKTYIFEKFEIFKEKQDFFIHPKIKPLFFIKPFTSNDFKQFFKEISILDLRVFLPNVFDPVIFKSTNSEDYIELNSSIKESLQLIWSIISKDITTSSDFKNFESANKITILEKLHPIEEWALIPVKLNKKTCLMPISKCDLIINHKKQSGRDLSDDLSANFIYDIFKKINLPTIDSLSICDFSLTESNIKKLLNLIATTLDKNEDIIIFLTKNIQDNSIFKDNKKEKIKESEQFRTFFNCSINSEITCHRYSNRETVPLSLKFKLKNDDSFSQNQIKELIRKLPIFTDVANRVETLDDTKKAFVLNLNEIPSQVLNVFCEKETSSQFELDIFGDIIDFTNKENMHLMRKESNSQKLYDYLGIPEINIEQFYELFFNYWQSNCTSRKINEMYKFHIKILATVDAKKTIDNADFLKTLKNVPFIEINSKFLTPSQVYDHENAFFKLAFESSILPLEYRTDEWRNFLLKLGLIEKIDVNHSIEIAKTLNKKYFANELTIKEVEEYSKNLFEKMGHFLNFDSETVNVIKEIKFIPNFFFGTENEFIFKIYSPLSNKQNDLISLSESVLKENKYFAWIIKPILPNYCENFLKLNKSFISEIVENDTEEKKREYLIKNFKRMIEIIQKDDFLTSLNENEIKRLFKVLRKNFLEFQKFQCAHELSKLVCVVNRKPFSKKLQMSPIKTIFKEVNEFDQINGLINKLPDELSECWEVLKSLGAKERIEFEDCQQILEHFYNVSLSNLDQKLTEVQFKTVMNIYKILIMENFFDLKEICEHKLYAPNMVNAMIPLNELYYVDSSLCERLLKNSDQLKKQCIFDINYLISSIESSSNGNITNNTLSHLIFKNLNWQQIFLMFSFFKTNTTNAAQPFSQILEEKISNDDEDGYKNLNYSLTSKLQSSKFSHAIFEVICTTDECLIDINFKKDVLIEDISKILKSMFIYEKEQIKLCYLNKKNNEKVEHSQKETFMAKFQTTSGIEFFIKRNFNDQFDLHLVELYLAETILDEVQKLVATKNYDSNSTNSNEYINEVIRRKSSRLNHLLVKLLSLNNENYDEVINQFKLNSIFNN